MVSSRKRKLVMLLFFMGVLGCTSALVLYALRQNISLFYSPSQVVHGDAPLARLVRIGGMVEKNSIVREEQGLGVRFKITDFEKTISVTYRGILPDLFKEGKGVVAEGELLDSLHFNATQILAKHDENYMSPQVRASLAKKVNP